MLVYLRPCDPGAVIFFTLRLVSQGSELLLDQVARLRQSVRVTRQQRPFQIEAFVVLPDHLHCIWRLPRDDTDCASRWQLIKTRFCQGLAIDPRHPGHVAGDDRAIWQSHFWPHAIGSRQELRDLRRYCWQDPVRHGLVTRPEDWLHSSVHRDRPMVSAS